MNQGKHDAVESEDDRGVAQAASNRDQDAERDNPDAHHAGRDGESVAEARDPGEEQRPDAVALEPDLRPCKLLRTGGKPAMLAEPFDGAAEPPEEHGAECAAECRRRH